ncbi:MAG TPA: hypothetical protein VLF71_05335 [Candidatus Saccharimonadales bacterium]|nr:hypothetical protein [Candidatus Saccharimonadales bacterium]
MFAVPGHSVNTLYNVAILAATFRLFAEHEGLVPFLTAQGDAHAERHGLPPLPPTGPLPGDEVDHFTLALPARDAVRWLLRDESDDYHLANPIDHGLRIIGALALMPPGSGIAVQDSHDKVYGYAPPLILEGLDPYPAGFGFAGMPPQQ